MKKGWSTQVEPRIDPSVYQAAFHNSPFAGLIVERRAPGEVHILAVNEAARENAPWDGARAEDVIGRSLVDVVPGLRAAGQLDACERALDNQQIIDLGEFAFEAAGLEPRLFSACAIPLGDGQLLITGETGTTRARDAERPEKVLEWYRSMVTASTDLTVFIDSTYTFRAANRAFCNEHGRTSEEILGQTVAAVFGEEVFETTLKPRLDLCLSGEQVTSGSWWDSPTQGRRHLDERYTPFLEADGSVSGVVVDSRDTTDQMQVEQLLERSVAALEEANRELEGFSDSLAHDLKSPLLTVTQFSEYLDKAIGASLAEPLSDYLRRIRAAGRHMKHIIDDLRDLTDVRRGGVGRDEVDLSEMGQEIIDELHALVPGRALRFEAQPGVTAVGDRTLLRLLLTNLLQNAWKYTGPCDDAWVLLGVEADEGDVPTYFVRDNGIGFDNAESRLIFRAFERLHTALDFAGSGLGLATVDRIVRRHGGRVWADGIPDGGAVFRFTLEPQPKDTVGEDRRKRSLR